MVSLLNILVFYIMLLNHSLRHVSLPAEYMICFLPSDLVNLESLFLCGAASPENLFPSLSASPSAPQKKIQPTGRAFPKEALNKGEPSVIELLYRRYTAILKGSGSSCSVFEQKVRVRALRVKGKEVCG